MIIGSSPNKAAWAGSGMASLHLALYFLLLYAICLFQCVSCQSVLNITPQLLTVASVHVSYENARPPWVSQLLGSEAFHYDSTITEIKNIMSSKPVSAEETKAVRNTMQKFIAMISAAHNDDSFADKLLNDKPPQCSVEILAYLNESEFAGAENRHMPFVGISNLRLGLQRVSNDQHHLESDESLEWQCIYRGLHENWRYETKFAAPHFKAIVYYCYSPQQYKYIGSELPFQDKSCSDLQQVINSNAADRFVPISLSLPRFIGQSSSPNDVCTSITKVNLNAVLRTSTSTPRLPASLAREDITTSNVVVCLVLPYSTSDSYKRQVTEAMLVEWIRYYQLLGMRVVIFDRDGANRDVIFSDSEYKKTNNIRIPVEIPLSQLLSGTANDSNSIVYFDFTIRGLLHPTKRLLKYDNSEPQFDPHIDLNAYSSRKARFESQGHDKVLTNTYCRFELSALFGAVAPIKVLVIDADEFIYCPSADRDVSEMRRFINRMLQQHQAFGTQQLLFQQRLTLNKTASPTDCMHNIVDDVRYPSEGSLRHTSIFQCFADNRFYMGGHSVKALYFDHSCPLTGYHFSCPYHPIMRTCDCQCKTTVFKQSESDPSVCTMLHLSMKIQSKGYINRLSKVSKSFIDGAVRSNNSLHSLLTRSGVYSS